MSGHSKWATTKHKKAAVDAKRGQLFTKLIREITITARVGGGDPDGNARLRVAITKAKESNMPADNVKKAIQRGTGELPGVQYDEMTYEGYGPRGVAMLIRITTDNKNRTASEIRYLLSRNSGNMGESGSVGWMFEKKGQLILEKKLIDEEKLIALALDAGAEDVRSNDPGHYEVITDPADFEKVKKALADTHLTPSFAEVTYLPQNYIPLEGKDAEHMLKLIDLLEAHEDVQSVHANFDISDEVMAKISE